MRINFKAVGATLLIAGTMMGAGMLALPLVSAGMGFFYACLTMFVIWVLMSYTGLMLLEVCLSFPEGSGFDAIAQALFGSRGSYLFNANLLFLLYALSAAYISGGGSTYRSNLQNYFNISISSTLISILFAAVIGSIVFLSTRAVDKVNRLLFSTNVVIFLVLIIIIQHNIHYVNLSNHYASSKYILGAIPIFMTAFGFHGSVPSLVKYVGRDHPDTLRNAFVFGSLIPLGIYILWVFCTIGVLPRFGTDSFQTIFSHHGSVGMFLDQIRAEIPAPLVPSLLSAFSSIAMFTSYLCVSLGLFDAMASTLKRSDTTFQRMQTAIITYLPPLIFALFFPNGFVAALGAAAIFLVFIAILFPVLSLNKLRAQKDYSPRYRVIGGGVLHKAVGAIGIVIIVLQLLVLKGLLPLH